MKLEEMERIVTEIESDRNRVKKNKVLSMSAFRINNKNDSTLISSIQYDPNGNLIETMTHRFRKFKDIDNRYYSYDSLNKRLEEYSILSFSEGFKHNYLKYSYDSIQHISSIVKGSGFENIQFYPYQTQQVIHDSSQITKNTNGTIKSAVYFDYPELNRDSMSIQETHEYHYLENGLLLSEDIYLSGVLWRQIYYNSTGYMIERFEYDTRSKQKKVLFHSKWIYNQSGLLLTYLRLKKSGKKKNCVQYHYEYR
ncbi:MAG: hypothetical protein ACJAUD_000213 [Crocinitomicaceae bacterium]|jgi:hypothetical protein